MHFQGAVVREQGQTFAVVVVRQHVLDNRTEAAEAMAAFVPAFPGMPIVLMAQDSCGRPRYRGRPDIARFLASIPMTAIPWRDYTTN
ncbi:MAG: hypothetical protein ACRESX_08285 [Gammaproteobacteria bacterium]